MSEEAWGFFVEDCVEANVSFSFDEAGCLLVEGSREYGDTSAERTVLEDNGIGFRSTSDGRYEISGSVIAWFPGMRKPLTCPADQRGTPMLPVEKLAAAIAAGHDIARLAEAYEPFVRPMPAMTIDGRRATQGDLARMAEA